MNIHGTLLLMFSILNLQQVLAIHIVEIQLTAHLMMTPQLKTILQQFLLGLQSSQNFKQTIFIFLESHTLVFMYLI
jgi:hypothetical protein